MCRTCSDVPADTRGYAPLAIITSFPEPPLFTSFTYHRRQGNVEEAERLCRAALRTLEEESNLGPDHVHVAATLVTLADLLARKVR